MVSNVAAGLNDSSDEVSRIGGNMLEMFVTVGLTFAGAMGTVAAKRPDAYNRVAFVIFAFVSILGSIFAFYAYGYRDALEYAVDHSAGEFKDLFQAEVKLLKAWLWWAFTAYMSMIAIMLMCNLLKEAFRVPTKPE
ncbi:hypothetical protein [Sphingosinicella sp.]|uniref:hypothetical protein n=1 Tax=Sphingosinicella sp. TaxID=1917971 RepID=UPI0025F6D5CB|nr:hypothetical protein [Sphingosinicella sp.]